MLLVVEEIAGNLEFGVSADHFEDAFNRLGIALGFNAQRPDREWKEGPDNLSGNSGRRIFTCGVQERG